MNRLLEHHSLSRADLAEVTGLNKSTVSSLIQNLLDYQIVREVGLSSSGVGRPSMLLELNPEAGYIVSCEIGVDTILIGCANFGAEIIWRYREDTRHRHGQQAIIERVLALLDEAIATGERLCRTCGGLLGIAIGVPGLVDHDTGTLLFAPNLGWQDVPLRAILQERFENVTVFVENEANMAALGEYFFGAARGCDEVLFISAGVGLGGALIRDGNLLHGATGFAGEFGHMTMDPDGALCNCGNQGCWETQVSQTALFRTIRHAIQSGRSSLLSASTGGDLDRLTVPLVVEAARAGDPVALYALEQVGHDLGIGIASLVNALNPELIVVGNILSLAGEFVLPAVEAELHRRALPWNANGMRIVPAQHGFEACVMGGVAIVYQAVLSQPGRILG
ncbi:MAG: ROK family protein [Chloroflexi bacterium]|nr:ROK family protein [Chloroflexota bacterium]